jgi:hypothetical protein
MARGATHTFPVMRMRRFVPLLACMAGCYTYAPLDPVSTQPGTSVRARVSPTIAQQLEPLLGMETRLLNGTLIASGPDTLIIEVPTSTRTHASGAMITLRQRVSVARSGLLELESRRLNRGRTAVVVAGSTVGLGAVVLGAYVLGPGKEKLPGGDGGTDLRIRIFLWRW